MPTTTRPCHAAWTAHAADVRQWTQGRSRRSELCVGFPARTCASRSPPYHEFETDRARSLGPCPLSSARGRAARSGLTGRRITEAGAAERFARLHGAACAMTIAGSGSVGHIVGQERGACSMALTLRGTGSDMSSQDARPREASSRPRSARTARRPHIISLAAPPSLPLPRAMGRDPGDGPSELVGPSDGSPSSGRATITLRCQRRSRSTLISLARAGPLRGEIFAADGDRSTTSSRPRERVTGDTSEQCLSSRTHRANAKARSRNAG